jgi:POT family proton-dependent oligopeptide transporter
MTDTRWFGHPRGLSTLFFTEMWERFSYYGMRAILVLFMTNAVATGGMGMDDVTATAIYGLYTAAVYVVALPGGWIADHLLGLRRAVFWGGTVIALGHFTLDRHWFIEAEYQRDCWRPVSRRWRAPRRRILDLLHGD